MRIKQFTENGEILNIIDDLKARGIDKKCFSNVIDEKGHQYVDLVQEGGGVLGIALLGYTYILEQMDIRFLQLAGTSAGAINTLLMAAAGKIDDGDKSTWILEQLANQNLKDFIDGDDDAKDFIDGLLEDSNLLLQIFNGAQVLDNFREDFGLNPGTEFHKWITKILSEKGISTLKELEDLRLQGPEGGIKLRDVNLSEGQPYTADRYKRVAIIAADITTESKIEFPKMAELYWSDRDEVNPADFVRASMSIPLFFQPFKVNDIPQSEAWARWKKLTGYVGNTPDEVLFIDGGIMSNFPIDLFHNFEETPDAPTFGVKLGLDRTRSNKNDKIFKVLNSIFNSARHVHDYDFILRNPDYRQLICYIETGNHNWLNFNISDEDKIDLFIKGAKAAAEFLKNFDWKEYQQLRAITAKMYKAANKKTKPTPEPELV